MQLMPTRLANSLLSLLVIGAICSLVAFGIIGVVAKAFSISMAKCYTRLAALGFRVLTHMTTLRFPAQWRKFRAWIFPR